MKLTLGFSTCPNDTFIFDALVHKKIDTEGLNFTVKLADVEKLNREAINASIDITKISYHAYAYVSENYLILNSGSALGNNNGPLLISKQKIYPDELSDLKIAIPGKYTTANLLLSIAEPKIKEKREYLFSDIEEAILSNEVDAGLIIHENRFTFEKKGLRKIIDVGEFWEKKTGLPIPLGGIIVKRSLPVAVRQKIDRVLRSSIDFALENPRESLNFMKQHAQEMNEEVMYKHINLYVNDYTKQLGEVGRKAIEILFLEAEELQIISKLMKPIFNTE